MRRAVLIVLGIFFLVIIAAFVAASLLDPEQFREPLAAELSEMLEREVTIQQLEMDLFPLPSVQASDVVVAGKNSSEPASQVKRLDLELAVLPLIFQQVVLRSVTLDEPRLYLPESAPAKSSNEDASTSADKDSSGETERAFSVAVDRVSIRNGVLIRGPWVIEKLNFDGSLSLDQSATGDFDAEIHGSDDVDLAGVIRGSFEAGLENDEVTRAAVEIVAKNLALKLDDLGLKREVKLSFELGGPFHMDLSNAGLSYADSFKKPAGMKLVLDGTLGDSLTALKLTHGTLQIADAKLPIRIENTVGGIKVELSNQEIKLESIAELLDAPLNTISGPLVVEGFTAHLSEPSFNGKLRLNAATIDLGHGPVQISGPFLFGRNSVNYDPIQITIADQFWLLSGGYNMTTGNVEGVLKTEGTQVEPVATRLFGKNELGGTIDANFDFLGPPDLELLRGKGRFEIRDGVVRGFSILKQVFGELGEVAITVAEARGKDLSKYDEERFSRMFADYTTRAGLLKTSNLTIEYKHSVTTLGGTVNLGDGTLKMSGRVVLRKELDADLTGQAGQERVIPIAGLTGTIDDPKIKLDRKAVATLATTYAGGGRIREKLEKELGKDGADAVQSILNQLLRGESEE